MKQQFVNLKMRILSLIFILIGGFHFANAQDKYEEYEEEKDSTRFFFGVNLGAHFPNNNSAIIYTGRPSVTQFGIPWIFNNPFNQQAFNDYFRFPYQVSEYPQEPAYKNSVEIGLHAGYEISNLFTVFFEVNSIQLDYEQFFTVAINDPNNQFQGPVFEQIPIIGEEFRFYFNLGAQFNYFTGETSKAYVSFFGNMNNVYMRRNYIVIDNVNYEIIHIDENNPDLRPGGIGFGGGGGLGFRFQLTDHILMDPYYNLYYTQINYREEKQPTGVHHSLGIRILWN